MPESPFEAPPARARAARGAGAPQQGRLGPPRAQLGEATGALLKEEASYFAGFNAFAIEDCPTDSASLQALMRFIEAKRTEAAELQSVEAVILTELKGEAGDNGLIALLEHFELHWRIRDVQRDAHRRHRTQPEPRVLYLLWDFKDINRC